MLGITEVNHVGIRVSHKTRSTEFCSVLGFELISDAGFESGHPLIMKHPSGYDATEPCEDDGYTHHP